MKGTMESIGREREREADKKLEPLDAIVKKLLAFESFSLLQR